MYFQGGNPTKKPIGINTISQMSVDVAKWLQKSPEEAKKYTAHCWRRTGATFIAESGSSLQQLKIAGGWKSSTIAEQYIDKSLRMKRSIGESISISDNDIAVSSAKPNLQPHLEETKNLVQNQYNFDNSSNCHFHFIISPPNSPEPARVSTSSATSSFVPPLLCPQLPPPLPEIEVPDSLPVPQEDGKRASKKTRRFQE